MENLNAEQIKKALECCMDEMGCTKGCPCFNPKAKGSHCTVSKKLELEKLTLDLINRLQAENERLKYNLKAVLEERADYTEAYIEFVERLCEDRVSNDPVVIAVKCATTIIEEDTEEKNDKERSNKQIKK